MSNRYLIEVKKPGNADYAIAGTRHGKTMGHVLDELYLQVAKDDSIRISLLSVALIAVRDPESPMGFKAEPVSEGVLRPA